MSPKPGRSPHDAVRAVINKRQTAVDAALRQQVDSGARLTIVKAPPGSGKTHTLLATAAHAVARGLRVAVSVQTRSQADDVCRRIGRDYPKALAYRFAARGDSQESLGPNVSWTDTAEDIRLSRCVAVATTAKWGSIDLAAPFDLLLVDEAWQMAMADFIPLSQVAGRFILIGDPGQIPPVVTIETSRWETSPRAPHRPAPEVILKDPDLFAEGLLLELPASRRLPFDTVDLIRPFYDFAFDSWAGPGERAVVAANSPTSGALDTALAALRTGTVVGVTLPTPDGGPPLEKDDDLAGLASRLASHLLQARAVIHTESGARPLAPEAIGLSATHRTMNTALNLALPEQLRERVRVDTPERWQGLECDVMIAIHPLSGVTRPQGFDLETGRICVMASRHRGGLLLLGRDHIPETLALTITSASQAVGRPDITGRGHQIHTDLWARLGAEGRIVSFEA